MPNNEFLKTMLQGFFIIATGILISIAVFCTLFSPDAMFSVDIFWKILLLSFVTVLPNLIFCSNKELSKKQMLTRTIIHIIVLITILLFFAYSWDWIDNNNIIQPSVFICMVLAVYGAVKYLPFQNDNRVAKKLNLALKRYNQERSDK